MKQFHQGGWGFLLMPVVIIAILLGYIWYLDSDQEAEDAEGVVSRTQTMFRVEFESLPATDDWHYELWARYPHGGEQQIGGIRVREGGTVVTLAGAPVHTLPLSESPPHESEILLTVEPGRELVEERSNRVLLRGVLGDGRVELSPVLPEISSSQYAVLATPTGSTLLSDRGVWFARDENGTPGLSLPELPEGWKYHGWLFTPEGQTLPMGRFRDSAQSDDASPYSGSGSGWDIPGEDFLNNIPEGVETPISLSLGRAQVAISMEPDVRDLSVGRLPFISLLSTRIPFDQNPGEPFELPIEDDEGYPRGTVKLVIAE